MSTPSSTGGGEAGGPFGVFESEGEADTVALGARLAAALEPGDVVAIAGELGAGKTRFVRGLASGLGHDAASVSSPTYVLAHEYDTPGARCPLVHIDAYRLAGGLDADAIESDLGLDERTRASVVVASEWAERLRGADGDLLVANVYVVIEHAGGDRRRVTIERA